jgi:hypothetical protein
MDTIGLTRERFNSRFLNVKFHVVLTPMLYRVNVSLESFSLQETLCCDTFLDNQQIREIWKI